MAKARQPVRYETPDSDAELLSRNEQTGRQLAELYGFAWQADAAGLEADLLLNTTPIGMPGSPEEAELAFTEAHIAAARVVFDMVAAVSGTPLIHAANAAGKTVIRGTEVFALQAVDQFRLYTGIRPTFVFACCRPAPATTRGISGNQKMVSYGAYGAVSLFSLFFMLVTGFPDRQTQ